MRFAFYTVCPSPHQYPLACEIVERVGEANFRYISFRETEGERAKLGWSGALGRGWEILPGTQKATAREWLENAEVLFSYIRDIDLFARRTAKGLKTFYCAERWFKPISIGVGERCWCSVPGSLRMLVPSYRRMAKRFVKWANEDPKARVFPIGPHAKRDFVRMGVRADKLVDWGYFVAPSSLPPSPPHNTTLRSTLRVLWVGRMLAWKRGGDIECAVAIANKNLTSAVPHPPESPTPPISFTKLTGVPLAKVRAAMRSHDVYVLASNAEEGWGAVLNEALEEGMRVIGTFEAGASAAILPRERLYHAGDVKVLARLLELEYRGELPPCSIGDWTAKKAAQRLINLI